MSSSRSLLNLTALIAAGLVAGAAPAQTTDFSGKWLLVLDSTPDTDDSSLQLRVLGLDPSPDVDYGILEISGAGDESRVFIDGGPVNVLRLAGNQITFDFDWTDSGDIVHVTELAGELTDGRFTGEMTEGGEKTGIWFATPWTEHSEIGADPDPVDISGVWLSLSRGTHKDSFDLTATGAAINAAYDPIYDDPHLRCVTGGVIRMEDGPFGQEIIQRDDYIVVLYQYFHEVRRIWLDGRDFPEDIENAYLSMGYSIGHWEGSTLVIETRGMKPTVWDASGMPTSTSAVVIERKYLDDEGRLHTDYTLHDPANFSRPVYRHAYRERSATAEITESSCDPHSFYRGLDLEDRFGEYWRRSSSRF